MTRTRFTWSTLALVPALVLPATAMGQRGQAGNQIGNRNSAQQANQRADRDAAERGRSEADSDQAKQRKQLKIFELEYCSPREISDLLRRYGGATALVGQRGFAAAGAIADPQAPQIEHPYVPDAAGPIPEPGPPGVIPGGAPGTPGVPDADEVQLDTAEATARAYAKNPRLAQGAGAAADRGAAVGNRNAQDQQVLIATDDERGLLFVRGPQEKIDEIGQLIEAVDVPADQMKKHQFRGVHLIPIRDGDGERINDVLGQLQIQSTTLNLGEARVIALREEPGDGQSQDQLEQAEQIISKLTGDRQRSESQEQGSRSEEQSFEEIRDDV